MTMRHLTALLMSTGSSFQIHAVGCADIKKTVARGKVQNRFNFKAETEHDAVYEVYADQIDESVGEGEAFRYATTDEAIEGFAADVNFNPCCQLQWGKPATAKSTADRDVKAAVQRGRAARNGAPVRSPRGENKAPLTREAKRQLAHAIVTAADCVMDQLDGVGLKGIDRDEAAQVVANWLHHLPVDQAWFVSNMKYLPKPDRSDWR